MTQRSTDSLDDRTAWSAADESDDAMEFDEFAPAPAAGSPSGEEAPPAWFRRADTGTAGSESAVDESADVEFAAHDEPDDEVRAADRQDVRYEDLDDDDPVPAVADTGDEKRVTPPPLNKRADDLRRGRSNPSRPANIPRIKVEKEGSPKLTWLGILLLAVKDGGGSFGVSLAVHTVIALALAYVVKESMQENDAISMTITDANSMPIEFEEIEDVSMDLAGGSELQVPQFQDIPLTSDSALTSNASELMSQAGSGEGQGGDAGSGFKFRIPEGGKAVSAGSFTAWTVPEDPKPGQDYMIVIRIKVPKGTTSYRVSDLSGQIVGTDGYTLTVPVDRNPSRADRTKTERSGRLVPVKSRDRLRVVEGHVQLMVDVPGAASLTRDSIRLKSKLLKEEQKLEIVF